jgi:hypothetical protein
VDAYEKVRHRCFEGFYDLLIRGEVLKWSSVDTGNHLVYPSPVVYLGTIFIPPMLPWNTGKHLHGYSVPLREV